MADYTEPQIFKYVKPQLEKGKAGFRLCLTEYIRGVVQVIKDGGENNLHYHQHLDGMWMVLGGRARFYGEGDVVLAELGRHEGILIPRGFKYWFESASNDEELELLQVEASDISSANGALNGDRVDAAPRKLVQDAERTRSYWVN